MLVIAEGCTVGEGVSSAAMEDGFTDEKPLSDEICASQGALEALFWYGS